MIKSNIATYLDSVTKIQEKFLPLESTQQTSSLAPIARLHCESQNKERQGYRMLVLSYFYAEEGYFSKHSIKVALSIFPPDKTIATVFPFIFNLLLSNAASAADPPGSTTNLRYRKA